MDTIYYDSRLCLSGTPDIFPATRNLLLFWKRAGSSKEEKVLPPICRKYIRWRFSFNEPPPSSKGQVVTSSRSHLLYSMYVRMSEYVVRYGVGSGSDPSWLASQCAPVVYSMGLALSRTPFHRPTPEENNVRLAPRWGRSTHPFSVCAAASACV